MLVGIVLALSACSNRQIYDTVQQNHRLECARLPDSAYEQCMAETGPDYDEYARQRDALMHDGRRL